MKTNILFEVRNKEGFLLRRHEQPSRSFTLNFIGLLYVMLSQASPTLKDIGNTNRSLTISNQGGSFDCIRVSGPGGGGGLALTTGYGGGGDAASCRLFSGGGDVHGIVVGTDATGVVPLDYKLGARIVHGSGAGQFEYSGCEVVAPVFVNPNGTMIIRRYFYNHSGGGITVQECGIYSPGYRDPDTKFYAFCAARDVVAPGVLVGDTQYLKLEYTAQITV